MDHRALMSGESKGGYASAMRTGLYLASKLYALAAKIRNRRFDAGRDIHQCGVPVISVGNLTAGGTGKTPVVCFLARWFRDRGIRVAIVSRGYGRRENDLNDEAMELYARLPDVPHIQDPDRVEAARIAVEELETQLVLMDDGFQHRRLHRDLDLVVVDATCPFGYGHLLPRGLLREPVSAVQRADLVLISRSDHVDALELQAIRDKIRQYHSSIAMIPANHRPSNLMEHPDRLLPLDALHDKKVIVLCAIGNPHAFVQTVKNCGANVVAEEFLPDHDGFTPKTVRALHNKLAAVDADLIVCTHKDLVKLQTDRIGGKCLQAILIDLEIQSDQAALEQVLENIQRLVLHSNQ